MSGVIYTSKVPFRTIAAITASVMLTSSCVSSRKEDSFSEFLHNESLELTGFETEATDIGHHVTLRFVDPGDPNRRIEGALFLVDLEKDRAQRIENEEYRRERRKLESQERLTHPNLIHWARSHNIGGTGGDFGPIGFLYGARPLESERVRERFPDHRIFIVSSGDPIMHPIYSDQPLIIPTRHQDDGGSFLKVLVNAPTVATFISDHKQPVPDIAEARETLELFCELQSWTMQKGMPENFKNRDDAKNADWVSRWTYRETENPDGWRFQAVFLTDAFNRSYWHVEIDVFRDGTVKIRSQIPM